jgi:membrane protein involved in colicin uptake
MSAGDTPPPGFIGDAVIRFGGSQQAASTQEMPFTKTKAQLAAEKAAAEKAAAEKAAAEKAAAEKAAAEKAAAEKAAAEKAAAEKAAALKKKSIICVKGKVSRMVTSKNPKCPSGYKIKK